MHCERIGKKKIDIPCQNMLETGKVKYFKSFKKCKRWKGQTQMGESIEARKALITRTENNVLD